MPANKCLNCFINTEAVMEGDWKSLDLCTPARLWYEMLEAEKAAIMEVMRKERPARVLEVGCGNGRVIRWLLGEGIGEEIVGIDGCGDMVEYASSRFKEHKRVKLHKMRIEHSVPYPEGYFDVSINAMNLVGWSKDEKAWLGEMLRVSRKVLFSVYKDGNEEERAAMYITRGHKLIERDEGQLVLADCAVSENQVSRAYARHEIEEICRSVGKLHEIKDVHKLLFFCTVAR